ncbi:MAG: hypothetical protein WDA75_23960 [Candidatus Latescibacterota bacterium]
MLERRNPAVRFGPVVLKHPVCQHDKAGANPLARRRLRTRAGDGVTQMSVKGKGHR